MNCYKEEFISPYLCGYKKGFSKQKGLISLIEKWKTSFGKKDYVDYIYGLYYMGNIYG